MASKVTINHNGHICWSVSTAFPLPVVINADGKWNYIMAGIRKQVEKVLSIQKLTGFGEVLPQTVIELSKYSTKLKPKMSIETELDLAAMNACNIQDELVGGCVGVIGPTGTTGTGSYGRTKGLDVRNPVQRGDFFKEKDDNERKPRPVIYSVTEIQ